MEQHITAIEKFKTAQKKLLQRYNVTAKSQFVEIPAVEGPVHVLRTGTGPPAVMLPGFADPAAMWAPLMGKLKDYTLYAVDRPCFGLSGTAEHTTSTFRNLAVTFLEQVVNALNLSQPLFIGNSIGSLWITWLAIDRPDHVTAMVFAGCPAFWLGTSCPIPMRLLSVPLLGRFIMAVSPPSPKQVEAFAQKMAGLDLSQFPELRNLLIAAQKLPGAQKSIRELLHAVVRLRGARPEVAVSTDELSQIRQPILLIWGSDDAFGEPSIAKEAARLIPDATLSLVPKAGHLPWFSHPDEVNNAAEPFLRGYGKT